MLHVSKCRPEKNGIELVEALLKFKGDAMLYSRFYYGF